MKNWGVLAPEWLSMLSDYCLVVHLSTLQLPEQEFRSEHAVYHLKETFCNHFEVHCHVRRCRQRLRRGLDERNLSEFWLAPLTGSTWSVFLNDEHATITNNAKGRTEPDIAECQLLTALTGFESCQLISVVIEDCFLLQVLSSAVESFH